MSRSHLANLSRTYSDARSDYDAVRDSQYVRRRTGLPVGGAGADYHYRSQGDFLKLLELARDIDRNDLLVGQGIDRAVANVVQTGFNPDPQTGDTEADDLLLAEWDDWSRSKRCHSGRTLNWQQMERLVFRAAFLVDGDHFGLPIADDGSLQCVEAHRVRTPSNTKKNVVHGVLLNDREQPVQYWITKADVEPSASVRTVGEVAQYPAFDGDGEPLVFHVLSPKRVSQHRGITAFVPIAKACGIHDDSLFAKLVKEQVASCFAFVREKTQPQGTVGLNGEPEERTSSAGVRRLLQHIYPGMEPVAEFGEKISPWSPQVQSNESMAFSMLVLSIIAVNIGVPVAVLLLDPSNTNFSGWRGAMDQARIGFKARAQEFIGCWHEPVWKFRVRWLLASGTPAGQRLAAIAERIGSKIFQHRWNAQSYGYIEPLKDATADSLRLDRLLTSPRRLHAEHGADWFQVIDEAVEDNGYAIRRAIKEAQAIAQETGVTIHWRECLSLTGTSNLAIAVSTSEGGAANVA